MRDKMKNPIVIIGKNVILEEISPKYFRDVIRWRNDKGLNRFLNQPFELTLEIQDKWYREKYLTDDTQGLLIVVERFSGRPVATMGWTDMDYKEKRCVGGRLLMPDKSDAELLLEAEFLSISYILEGVDDIYCHVALDNKRALRWNKALGYRRHTSDEEIVYPDNIVVNNIKHVELILDKENFKRAREAFMG